MNNETKERMLSDLEEAKGSFDILIEQMKLSGMNYPYEKTIVYVNATYKKSKIKGSFLYMFYMIYY